MRLTARPDAGATLVFVPPVLGSSTPYLALSRAVTTAGSYGLFAPGMLDDGPTEDDVDALVDAWAAAVVDGVEPLPLFLVGYSVGGAEAVALAHELSRRGRDVRHVFALDPPLPSEHAARQRALAPYLDLTAELLRILDRVEPDGSWLREEWPTPEVTALLWNLRMEMAAQEKPARLRRLVTVQAAQKRAFAGFRFTPYAGAASLLTAEHGETALSGIAEWTALLPCVRVVEVGGRHESFVVDEATLPAIAGYIDSVVAETLLD